MADSWPMDSKWMAQWREGIVVDKEEDTARMEIRIWICGSDREWEGIENLKWRIENERGLKEDRVRKRGIGDTSCG